MADPQLKVVEQTAIAAARITRAKTRSLRSKIDKCKDTNRLYGLKNLTEEFMEWDIQRHQLREQLRFCNLTRAMLSGKDYLTVEQKTYNPVDSWELWSFIQDFTWSRPTHTQVQGWLGYESKDM